MKRTFVYHILFVCFLGLVHHSCASGGQKKGCGDGKIDPGEQCDGNALAGATCASLGYYNVAGLKCSNICTYDVSLCGGRCGDGAVDSAFGEECDGTNLNGATCQTVGGGFTGGSLSCGTNCRFNTAQCTGGSSGFCGDGVIDVGEQCDGTNLGGKTCSDYGFTSGSLSCTGSCTINTSGCTSGTTCTHNGFTNVLQYAEHSTDQYLGWMGYSADAYPVDVVSVEMYFGYGTPAPPHNPGTYPLAATADEQNYSTCGTCVLVRQNCNEGVGCSRSFLATGGSLVISSTGVVGATLSGSLQNVNLQEVTINPDTFQSTPVQGGQTWCIQNLPFSAQIEAY